MNNLFERMLKRNVRFYAILSYGLVLLFGVFLAYYFMPKLLNYGPDTINTQFDKEFSSGITYLMQFTIVYIALLVVEALWLLWETREFGNIKTLAEDKTKSKAEYERYLRVVQKCFSIPKFSFMLIAIAPFLIVAISFVFLNFTSFADFKVLLVVLTLSLIAGTLTFIVSKRIFRAVLQSIMNVSVLQKGKLRLTPAIMFQITPIAAICIMYTFFLSYSTNLDDKSELARKHYISAISENITEDGCNSIMSIENTLANTPTLEASDTIAMMDKSGTAYSFANEYTNVFVKIKDAPEELNPKNVYYYDITEGKYYSFEYNRLKQLSSYSKSQNDYVANIDTRYIERNKTNNPTIGDYSNIRIEIMDAATDFFYTYAKDLARKNNYKVYGYYGSEIQGLLLPQKIDGEELEIVVMYDLTNSGNIQPFFFNLIVLLVISGIVTYNFARSISKDVTIVTDGIDNLLNGNVESLNRNLPVTSNDELGELVLAFNKVQELTKENIVEIKNNEQVLMERERLASLGELIGGIAHNMKTPIMSTTGAAEGLTELVTEYMASIDNPSVTSEDHKEIAKDMLDCISKIKSYNSYMSDIITAVKGQASQLASQENEKFTLYDLSKRVEILIKHEIKQANLVLNVNILCDPSISLTGDINSLIQVINNLISNSIASYNGMPGKQVDYIIDADASTIVMKVVDTGCGMSEETKSKLFKQMYTTKGKNGTGLGLYMSYSTIKGKYNGNIAFTSEEGKGSTFVVTIPRNV